MSGFAELGDRSAFPDLDAFAYLNHAAVSPPSNPVREAVREAMDDFARRGLGAVGRWVEARRGLRARLARLIGAGAEDLALMQGTTTAVMDAALCLPWEAGDRVVCFRGEFPTNVTPWQRAAETFGLEVAFVDAEAFRSDEGLEALDAQLARGARLVAVSAVQFQTGLRMPLGEMAARCHAAGAELFVDAIQSVGVVPIDVGALGVDYLACGAHKWLMGMEGSGFLYVRPERQAALVPRVAGWLSHEDAIGFLSEGAGHLRYDRPLLGAPRFLEMGSSAVIAHAALDASAGLIEGLGVEAIYAHVQRYHDALEPALIDRGFVSERSPDPARRSGSLSVRLPQGVDLGALHRGLGERGVAASTPDGRLRFAPHWPNALDEVPRVIEALDDTLAALRG